jgi:hypothetical protein
MKQVAHDQTVIATSGDYCLQASLTRPKVETQVDSFAATLEPRKESRFISMNATRAFVSDAITA